MAKEGNSFPKKMTGIQSCRDSFLSALSSDLIDENERLKASLEIIRFLFDIIEEQEQRIWGHCLAQAVRNYKRPRGRPKKSEKKPKTKTNCKRGRPSVLGENADDCDWVDCVDALKKKHAVKSAKEALLKEFEKIAGGKKQGLWRARSQNVLRVVKTIANKASLQRNSRKTKKMP